MKFKHWATDKIIEVEPVESVDHEIVHCKELDKSYFVVRKKGDRTYLRGTSYVECVEAGK